MHLIEQAAAQKALDDACLKWGDGAQTAWDIATWAVLRDPEIGVKVTESGKVRAFTYEGARSIKQPSVLVLYELQGDTTVIHDAKFKDAPFNQVGHA